MENMQTGYSDSRTNEKQNRQAGSRRRLKNCSKRDPVEGDTPQAGPTPNDCEVELSILQSVYDQALSAGLRAVRHLTDVEGEPVLVLQLYGVKTCEVCGCWTTQAACPSCR